MVSEPDIGRCASKDSELEGEWTPDGVLARMSDPEGEWIVRSHIDWREEQMTVRTLGPERGGL